MWWLVQFPAKRRLVKRHTWTGSLPTREHTPPPPPGRLIDDERAKRLLPRTFGLGNVLATPSAYQLGILGYTHTGRTGDGLKGTDRWWSSYQRWHRASHTDTDSSEGFSHFTAPPAYMKADAYDRLTGWFLCHLDSSFFYVDFNRWWYEFKLQRHFKGQNIHLHSLMTGYEGSPPFLSFRRYVIFESFTADWPTGFFDQSFFMAIYVQIWKIFGQTHR